MGIPSSAWCVHNEIVGQSNLITNAVIDFSIESTSRLGLDIQADSACKRKSTNIALFRLDN